MTLPLDHIVIAVHDLAQTIADYTALGFTVLQGGDHPGRSTHNALVVFADGSYLELIAWKSPAPQERWWQLLQRHGEGIVDFALLPSGTAATVDGAARRGLQLQGPLDGGRLRPNGERLQWQIARPPTPDLPFLCGDITQRALRVPEGEARSHPNGAKGVASLAVVVHDLDATLARYRALLGEADIGPAVVLTGSGLRVAVVRIGASALVLSSPRDPAGGPSGPLTQRLATRGEGPYAFVLRTSAAVEGSGQVDTAQAHGALIEFEPLARAAARSSERGSLHPAELGLV